MSVQVLLLQLLEDGPPPPASAQAQTNNKLKLLLPNVQSLPPKMDEIIVLTQTENFDIIGVNETWLDTEYKHLQAEVSIEGYKNNNQLLCINHPNLINQFRM